MNQSAQSVQSLQSDTKESLYVHTYNITRSLTSFQLFNVVAVDRKGELLATVAVDMNFEDAASMTEALNASTDEVMNAVNESKDAE